MSEECSGNCEECGENCDHRVKLATLAKGAIVKKVIGVVSSKGGVGKSFVSSYLATLLARRDYHVAILDADITGPSIPFAYGLVEKAYGEDNLIIPQRSAKYGIQIISSNMLLENDEDPIIWRGPMIGNLVNQFYSEVKWEDVDFMVVDLPPGTSDVALNAFQSFGIAGLVIVTSPQGLVSQIVEKAIHMANEMNIKIIGIVENMSYVVCPKCQEKIEIYGSSNLEAIASKYGLKVLGRVPFDMAITEAVDNGEIESLNVNYLDSLVEEVSKLHE